MSSTPQSPRFPASSARASSWASPTRWWCSGTPTWRCCGGARLSVHAEAPLPRHRSARLHSARRPVPGRGGGGALVRAGGAPRGGVRERGGGPRRDRAAAHRARRACPGRGSARRPVRRVRSRGPDTLSPVPSDGRPDPHGPQDLQSLRGHVRPADRGRR